MDASFPRGGLEKLFRQYDFIVSHDAKPSWDHGAPETAAPEAQPAPAPAPVPPAPAPPGRNRLDEEADRMEAAEKRLNERLANPSGATFQQDEAGMVKAYADQTAPGVYYDPQTRTEYVKGSSTARDWYDDLTKIPIWGDTKDSERYQQAEKAYQDLHASGRAVDRVVGHSLGGSVALEMQNEHGIPRSRTFGAPVLDLNPFGYNRAERYRHPLDPVSIFDRGATWGKFKPYSHSYTGYEDLQKA